MLQPDFKKFCWNCNIGGGATSEELKERCLGEGSYQACSSGNSDCFVTMRKNEGKVNMLQMGCKQPAACANESSQTMQGQSPHCRQSFITRIWPIQTDIDWNPRHLKTLWTLGLVHRWRLYKRLLHRKREFLGVSEILYYRYENWWSNWRGSRAGRGNVNVPSSVPQLRLLYYFYGLWWLFIRIWSWHAFSQHSRGRIQM